jgi:hypothetical protein
MLRELGAMEQGESLVRVMEAETLAAVGDVDGARRSARAAPRPCISAERRAPSPVVPRVRARERPDYFTGGGGGT